METPISHNIVDLNAFRQKKVVQDDLVRNRRPLFASHGESDDFSARIARIRTSLDRIDALMSELKKLQR